MSEDTKKVSSKRKASAVKQAPIPKKVLSTDIVKVKNTCNFTVNTSQGSIKPGESGECTAAESRTYNKFLKVS